MKKHPLYLYVLPVLDWLTILGALVGAIILRGRSFGDAIVVFGIQVYGEVLFLATYAILATFVFHYYNLYKVSVFTTVVEHTIRLLKALVIIILGIALLAFFLRADFIVDSRLAIIYFTIVAFGLLAGGRVVLFRTTFLFLTKHKVFHRNALVVGAGISGKNVAVNAFLNDYLALNIVGFLDDELPLGKAVFNRVKVLGRVSELQEIVKVFDVDEIICCLENVDHTRFISVLEDALSGAANVKISSPLYDVISERLDVEKYGKIPVVAISQIGPGPLYELYKRVFDSLVSAIGMLLLAPVLVAIASAIKLESPGPIIFRQTRVGRNGKPFDFFKFRSMKMDSESTDNRSRELKYADLIKGKLTSVGDTKNPTKIVDENRVTRIGRFIRKTSLDELPQLLNVLRGDMSLVGPRPCLPYEWKHYEEWHKRRLSVTPGCTGMWQVVGRSKVGFQDMVILDLFYSQNASFHLDLWLLFKTIPVMVLGRGGK
jgi:exopolysaccharide biosynthesis polyprenyl glycosylphosphotransferase